MVVMRNLHIIKNINNKKQSDLLKISLSSCSETNCPRLATNKVLHGAVLTPIPGCDEGLEPTGDASAGEGKKCGNEAACIAVSAAVGWGIDSGGCRKEIKFYETSTKIL